MPDLSGRFAQRLTETPFALLGMLHLMPLPGSPRWGGSMRSVMDAALEDARTFERAGFDGVVVENHGDAPFVPHASSPATVTAMAVVVSTVRAALAERMLVGVNLMRNDAAGAMAVAVSAGADLIRVNVHVGSAWTDHGLIHGRAHETLRLRAALGAAVAIVADVLVKHAHPVVEADPTALARETVERGLADGLVVTGAATGVAVDPERLRRTVEGAGGRPVFAGSGTTPDAVPDLYAAGARGAIVGTWCKADGAIESPADPARAGRLVAARDRLEVL
jgi:membrane complex biogenesis BtpA family protein